MTIRDEGYEVGAAGGYTKDNPYSRIRNPRARFLWWCGYRQGWSMYVFKTYVR